MQSIYGVSLILISAISYATLPIFTRWAYGLNITLNSFLFYRFFFSFLLVFTYAIIKKIKIPAGKQFYTLFLLGALGYTGQAFVYLSAVKYASTGLVAILLYLYPAFVALIAILFFKEHIQTATVIGLITAFLGTALVLEPAGGQPLGFGLAIAAAMIYSVYITINGKFLHNINGIQSIVVIFGASALVLSITFLIGEPQFSFTTQGWLVILGCVVISTIIPSITFLEGLKRIGAVQSSLLSTIEPLVTVILSYLFFKEELSSRALLGGSLILGTVIMLNVLQLRSTKIPEKIG